mmetsp:Transcript_28070/g.64824  ORF Transcript_28070/g.64824 Transcript_28070/m.64824 type:complete len:228 (+) Transcript_28070:2260-2943(+)
MRAFELCEHLGKRFANHIHQHVQAATVWHSNHTIGDTKVNCSGYGCIYTDNGCLTTVNAKPFGRLVLRREEGLEGINLRQLLIDRHKLLLGRRHVAGTLYLATDPINLSIVVDVHVLKPSLVAVDGLELAKHITKCATSWKLANRDIHWLLQVGLSKAMCLGVQRFGFQHSRRQELPDTPLMETEWIQVCSLVTMLLICTDKAHDASIGRCCCWPCVRRTHRPRRHG